MRITKAMIAAEWKDEDGYWIELKSGWHDGSNPTCHTVHEDTRKECMDRLRDFAEPCNCWECKKDAADVGRVHEGGHNVLCWCGYFHDTFGGATCA